MRKYPNKKFGSQVVSEYYLRICNLTDQRESNDAFADRMNAQFNLNFKFAEYKNWVTGVGYKCFREDCLKDRSEWLVKNWGKEVCNYVERHPLLNLEDMKQVSALNGRFRTPMFKGPRWLSLIQICRQRYREPGSPATKNHLEVNQTPREVVVSSTAHLDRRQSAQDGGPGRTLWTERFKKSPPPKPQAPPTAPVPASPPIPPEVKEDLRPTQTGEEVNTYCTYLGPVVGDLFRKYAMKNQKHFKALKEAYPNMEIPEYTASDALCRLVQIGLEHAEDFD